MHSEGVPPSEFLLLVESNDLVPAPRKIGPVKASSLKELEEVLVIDLKLDPSVAYGVFYKDSTTGDYTIALTLDALPSKAKVQIRLRPEVEYGTTARRLLRSA